MFARKIKVDQEKLDLQKELEMWKEYAQAMEALNSSLEQKLKIAMMREEYLNQSNDVLTKLIADTLTSFADTNRDVVKAVNNMKGVVANMARPGIAVYANGTSQTC